MATFGRRIKEAREARGLTQKALALSIGLKSKQDINQLESRSDPRLLGKIEALASALGVSPAWLAFGDERG
jgi:transcriptional regulator with XRE-family HTH domain